MVEEGGVPVLSALKKTDPFHQGSCRYGDQECMVKGGSDCGLSGCLYEITCNQCLQPVDPDCSVDRESRLPGGQPRYNYLGMTRATVHSRMMNHKQGQKYRQSANPLHRHDVDHHGGEVQGYTARVLGRERSMLPLSIIEGLFIEAQIPGTSMNARNESGRGGLVRLMATRVI